MPNENKKQKDEPQDVKPEVGTLPAAREQGGGTALATGSEPTGIMASEMGTLFEQDQGRGSEDIGREDTSLAFLRILQSNSPECMEGDPREVPGARPGMFFNTLTKELWDGKLRDGVGGITAVMCYFRKVYNNWVPRTEGGGFRGTFRSKEEAEATADADGRKRDETQETVDTGEHYMLVLSASGDWVPVLFPVTSTKHKPSRDWNGRMKMLMLPGKRGPFNPPTYASMWQLTTVSQRNDKGSWHSFEAEQVGFVTQEGLYRYAEGFYKAVAGGDPEGKYRADYNKVDDLTEGLGDPVPTGNFDGDDRY